MSDMFTIQRPKSIGAKPLMLDLDLDTMQASARCSKPEDAIDGQVHGWLTLAFAGTTVCIGFGVVEKLAKMVANLKKAEMEAA
jgi:hypothetical protein